MHRGEDGIWSTRPADAAALADFAGFDHTPYMFRITKDNGSVAYRTDLYSRCQIGSGKVNPATDPQGWSGRRQDLDGVKSCSVVIDPERVARLFRECRLDGQPIECRNGGEPVWPETQWQTDEEFWRTSSTPTGRCRPGSRTWSSTSCTLMVSASAATRAACSTTPWTCSITWRTWASTPSS